jgi:transcriptional regulator with XRE-family HTH domain
MVQKTDKDIKLLGKRIDDLRKENGDTMRVFAKKCGISKSQVNELSKDGADFRYSTLIKIAKGLGMTVAELVKL